MTWSEYYERYDGWQESTQYSRLASITNFGPDGSPSEEISDCMIFPPLFCICNRNPSFTRCRFNLLGDTSAPLGGGSTCLKRMLQQERWLTVSETDVEVQEKKR